jgi:predicted HicB family RNase H-like nuclease
MNALHCNWYVVRLLQANHCGPMKPEQCNEQIVLRLPPTLRERVEAAAAAEGRSLSNMTRRILERWAAEHREGAAA